MTERQWTVLKHDRVAAIALAKELGISPLIAALLISRGYKDIESVNRFLSPHKEHLHDPILLKDIQKAVDRTLSAIEQKQKILIWGDYDVDGTTGTTLLRRALSLCGAITEYHIPNRFTEGYGVNTEALQAALERGCKLVITVDCGIRSFDPLIWANENGLDVIITDHHLSDTVRGNPPAVAVVNPNQPGCEYPDKHLAGVGVAFKFAQLLLRSLGKEELVWQLIKFAALGTIADIMRLKGENRTIVSLGLQGLLDSEDPGIRALMEISDCRNEMTSYDIGYRLAPRINAAGRMEAATKVIELFEAPDFLTARKIAAFLDQRNRERQVVQQEISDKAINDAISSPDDHVIVAAGEDWHRGVIGLAASRIVDKMKRPAIVLSVSDGIAHGSARSFNGADILQMINSCSDLLIQFGGHAAAAGLKMDASLIDEFRSRINEYAASVSSAEIGILPELIIDANVSSSTMGLELVKELALLEPFGPDNEKPVLLTENLRLRFDPTVMKDKHLKLYLADDNNKNFEAVWWNGVEQSKGQTLVEGKRIKIAYTPEANTWNGNTRLQLVVKDLKEHN